MAAFMKNMRLLCSRYNVLSQKPVITESVQKVFMQTPCARYTSMKQTQMLKYSCLSFSACSGTLQTSRLTLRNDTLHHNTESKINNVRLYSSDKGEQNEDEKKKSRKDQLKFIIPVIATGLSTVCILYILKEWGAAEVDDEGNVIEDEFGGDGWKSNIMRYAKIVQNPSRNKLLPDPVQYPYIQPPYTLVLEMKGVLVWPEHDINKGWRFKKRPGVKYLLQKTCDMFEIVIYTSEGGMTMDPIISQIDPHGFIKYRLYRDATKYIFSNFHHVKDLDCLNRDLRKVIIVDCDEKSYMLHKRNGFKIKQYEGEDDDVLVDLTHFLQALAATGVEDVRPVLDYYKDFDDPIMVFKENQRKLLEEQKALEQQKPKAGLGGFFRW